LLTPTYLPQELTRDPKLNRFFFDHEMPVAQIIAKMEQTGVHVDLAVLGGISLHVSEAMDEAKTRIFAHNQGEAFNLNSTKQLSELLLDKLDVPGQCGIKLTKVGCFVTV
jgi:DNA polymerase-1